MRIRPNLESLTLGLLALLAHATAAAQSSEQTEQPEVALNRFEPAFAGDRFFGTQSAHTHGHPGFHFFVMGDYAHNPLVLRRESDDEVIGAIVKSQLFLHANATLSLWNRVSVNVNAPIAVLQDGDDPEAGGTLFESPDSAQFGDLRAGLRLRLYGEYFDPFQIALGGYLWFPTGPSDSYVSDGSVRGEPTLIVSGRGLTRVVWSVSVGTQFRPDAELAGTEQGSMLRWGAGLGVFVDDRQRLQLGAELGGGFVYEQVDSRTLNSELLFGGRLRLVDDVEAGFGVGPGLSSGAGTPDFRGVLMIAYTPLVREPVAEPRDRDLDGILDPVDACPDEPGVASEDPQRHGCPAPADRDADTILDSADACPDEPGPPNDDASKNGCPPPPDRDADSITDDKDRCPDEPGVASEDPERHGCPPDRDGDGILDDKDACPDVKGIPSDDPTQNGCPPDSDGDGIRDDLDACPQEKGPDDDDPQKRGCPRLVRVTDKEIVISEQVLFDTGRATIKQASNPLIDEVVGVLNDHPEIIKLRVEGHTDNRGSVWFNTKLSQDRAQSVMKALIARGIAADRLSAKGYGPGEPIGDNTTEEGRQKNRRVQFTILEKAPKAGEGPAAPEQPRTEPAPEAPAP